MTYQFSSFLWAFPGICVPYSHEAPRAYMVDQPTWEEQNEQNEHGSEALTNGEQERTGSNFP